MGKILERYLNDYDRVLLFETEELISRLNQLEISEMSEQKIMILSANICKPQSQNITFRHISENEFQELSNLYFTYEFSDKFRLVSDNDTNYASLHHMVDIGILSQEEFFAALLS